jgi:hypothetical protein
MKNLTILLILLIACNNPKTPLSENNKQITNNSKTELKEELPPANICSSDLGTLRMDVNGHSTGTKTEITELKKMLRNKSCDIIEITYTLKGSYGLVISKKIIYDKRENRLQDISTQNNVIEDYKNVSTEGLNKFLAAGEKDFSSLEDYAGATYDFNNRQMTNKAVGDKPIQNELDGTVMLVENYIKANAKDASTIKFSEWSKVSSAGEYWVVRCKYKGINSFGTMVTDNRWFYIQNKKVIKTEQIY